MAQTEELESKFKLYQFVKTTSDRIKSVIGLEGYIYRINISSYTGKPAYGILFENGDECWYEEEDIVATEGFLPDELVQELYPAPIPGKYQAHEIVRITKDKKKPYRIGKEGYVYGISDDGKSYAVMLPDEHGVCYEEDELESTGKFLSEVEIKQIRGDGSYLKVSQKGDVTDVHIENPKNWQERTLTASQITGWKEEE